jgi:RNA polymerase sigma-70 factor (ECF subfamily)
MVSMGIEVASEGEQAIRELLLSRLSAAYRTATCILRDSDSAEDAVQEAALRAWTNRRQLRDPEKVDAWFSRIVVNVCRAELARAGKRRSDLAGPSGGGGEASVAGPGDAWAIRDETGRALARLTGEEQIVVALRFGRDLSVPQIAACTGLREGTVKSRLHSAQEHLRAAFDAERRTDDEPEARR